MNIISIVLIVCGTFAIGLGTAKAVRKFIEFDSVEQAKSNWCWAAAAENSVRGMMTPTRDQWDAVAYIKGSSNINEGGTLSETATAGEYISNNSYDYTYTPRSRTNGVKTYSFLVSKVNAGEPPIVTGGYYNGTLRTGGHAITVVGYYYTDTTKCFYFRDPLNNSTY